MTETLFQALKQIHARMQDPENWDEYGICRQLDALADEFREHAESWPEHSGSADFPIPGNYFDDENWTGSEPERMWDRETSPYAEKRWQLLEWLLA